MGFEIRKTATEDLERVMQIYAQARAFMAEHGNPTSGDREGGLPSS